VATINLTDVNPAFGPDELQKEYRRRFAAIESYRDEIWSRLVPAFFQAWIPRESAVLDLGCGYGEFINHVQAKVKYAMDLNPDAESRLNHEIKFFLHDCSVEWPLPAESLDVIFSSNFFEHLSSKEVLSRVIASATRCLKPRGRLICLGPNVKYLAGAYWDFWDHHIPLSDRSLQELLELNGLQIVKIWKRFLPFTMSGRFRPPPIFVDLYLKFPWIWPLVGRQFLIIAQKS
jgi:SAM-dependent methyltransferase